MELWRRVLRRLKVKGCVWTSLLRNRLFESLRQRASTRWPRTKPRKQAQRGYTIGMSALDTCLSTYELLERVLLFLPIPKLLVVQRVCRSWHELIESSDPIQKVLFRRPVDDRRLICSSGNLEELAAISPADPLGTIKAHANASPAHCNWHNGTYAQSATTVIPILNPLIGKFVKNNSTRPGELLRDFTNCSLFRTPPLWEQRYSGYYLLSSNSTSSQASWKTLLVMQPPARDLTFCCIRFRQYARFHMPFSKDGFEDGWIVPIHNDAGVQLESIPAHIEAHFQRCDSCLEATGGWLRKSDKKDSLVVRLFAGSEQMVTVRPETNGWDMLALFAAQKQQCLTEAVKVHHDADQIAECKKTRCMKQHCICRPGADKLSLLDFQRLLFSDYI